MLNRMNGVSKGRGGCVSVPGTLLVFEQYNEA